MAVYKFHIIIIVIIIITSIFYEVIALSSNPICLPPFYWNGKIQGWSDVSGLTPD